MALMVILEHELCNKFINKNELRHLNIKKNTDSVSK